MVFAAPVLLFCTFLINLHGRHKVDVKFAKLLHRISLQSASIFQAQQIHIVVLGQRKNGSPTHNSTGVLQNSVLRISGSEMFNQASPCPTNILILVQSAQTERIIPTLPWSKKKHKKTCVHLPSMDARLLLAAEMQERTLSASCVFRFQMTK